MFRPGSLDDSGQYMYDLWQTARRDGITMYCRYELPVAHNLSLYLKLSPCYECLVFVLGDSPTSEFCADVFGTLFHLNRSCRRFGTVCPGSVVQCSETSAHEIQPPKSRPKENLQYTFISPTNQILKTAFLLNCDHCHVYGMGTAMVRQACCACFALLRTVTYHECDCWCRETQWNLLTVWIHLEKLTPPPHPTS